MIDRSGIPEVRFPAWFTCDNDTITNDADQHERCSVICVADTGAGANYLLVTAADLEIFETQPCKPHTVFFANQSSQVIRASIHIDLTINSTDSDESFTERIEAFPLTVHDTTELELILGRDALQTFRMVIDTAAGKARIGDSTVYDGANAEACPTADDGDYLRMLREFDFELDDDIHVIADPLDAEGCVILHKQGHEVFRSTYPDTGMTTDAHTEDPDISIIPDPSGCLFGRIQTRIPWRNDDRPPRNKMGVAVRDNKIVARLSGTEKTLFDDSINELIEGGYATTTTSWTARHYISVNPVFKTGSTTRCRLCVDARVSNHYTAQGSTQTRPQLECFALFRTQRFASIFDLSKAFWKVLLHPDDQPYCCSIVGGQEIMFRALCFGCNYSPCVLECAIRLLQTAATQYLSVDGPHHIDEPPRPTNPLVFTNYVDDFCTRSDDVEVEKRQASWWRWFLARYGFSSSKFASNAIVGEDSNEWFKYLGYEWQPSSDTVRSRVYSITPPDSGHMTVKQLLSALGTFYDPMGYHLNIQLLGRILFRDARMEVNALL